MVLSSFSKAFQGPPRSADLRDVDVVTLYGRPGDSFMELAAKKMEELPPNAAVVGPFAPLSHHFRMKKKPFLFKK